MKMRKRFVIHPGRIKSATDGDLHYIGFRQLVELYDVNALECINAEITHEAQWRDSDLIHLRPQYRFEDYKNPDEVKT